MKKPLKRIPDFKTEAEERAFWEDPNNDTTEYFDAGNTVPGKFPNLKPSTQTTSLRLPKALLDETRIEAHKRDFPTNR